MKKKFFMIFILSLVIFLLIFIGLYPIINPEKIENKNSNNNIKNQANKVVEDDRKEITFLLMGIDDEFNLGGVEAIKESMNESDTRYFTTGMRSDTMILCKYNFETGKPSLISIPRDLKTSIRTRLNEEKIAHAHSHGGPYLALDTVSDLMGINIDYYLTVDYKAVKEIVDAIGGIDVYVPRDMSYIDPVAKPPLYIELKEGQQKLDGDSSLQFLRYRSYKDGDLGRVNAQQEFMKALIKEVFKPSILLKLPTLTKTYFEYIDTNIPISIVLDNLDKLNRLDISSIEIITIKGEAHTIDGTSYFIYDEDELKKLVEENFNDNMKVK